MSYRKTEPYLHRCVNSVIGQQDVSLEIILVDDGSKDSSPQICDEYARLDHRIRAIHQVNKGAASARNAGILA